MLPFDLSPARAQRNRVTVSGTITEVDPEHHRPGASHQILSIRITTVLAVPNRVEIAVGDLVNVAIRFGDAESMPSAIPGLQVGAPITVCGAYISAQQAYPEADGDKAAVIHFTHHPVGWVEYGGKHYE